MAEFILVRHGQAHFGSNNYDQLSELGHTQSRLLGEYLKDHSKPIDLVATGTLSRHAMTSESLLKGLQQNIQTHQYAGLNEYDFNDLITSLHTTYPNRVSKHTDSHRAYYHNIDQALQLWMQGSLKTSQESWETFVNRVMESFQSLCDKSVKRIVVISSGGPIAVILGKVLGLANDAIRRISLQIKNSSSSRLLYNREYFTLDTFNCTGHLENSRYTDAITFV